LTNWDFVGSVLDLYISVSSLIFENVEGERQLGEGRREEGEREKGGRRKGRTRILPITPSSWASTSIVALSVS
jgi:hypothetical protein